MDVIVSKDVLKKMLTEAFDAGWNGILELKESAVEDVLKRHDSDMKPKNDLASNLTGYIRGNSQAWLSALPSRWAETRRGRAIRGIDSFESQETRIPHAPLAPMPTTITIDSYTISSQTTPAASVDGMSAVVVSANSF